MKNILIAVDDTKSTREIFSKCTQICKCMAPDKIILLYVEKFEGQSLVTDMLGDNEIDTLRDVLEGTEFKAALDAKAETILGYYKGLLEQQSPVPNVVTVVRTGHPAEQILQAAEDDGVDMILIGSRGKRGALNRLMMGSVSREVANTADRPVLIVK